MFSLLPNSLSYIGFILVTCTLYWLAPPRMRTPLLVLFGVVFYAQVGLSYFLLFLALMACTYAAGMVLSKRKSPFLLSLSILSLLLVLSFFKYIRIVTDWITLPPALATQLGGLLLPLGISFFTFEFIHYLVDIYRGKIAKSETLPFLGYAFFFPSRLAGPIKRYEDFSQQLAAVAWKNEYLYWGVLFLVFGYAQKIIIADSLIPFTEALRTPETLGALRTLTGLYAYSVHIYADFMGLTNIAIGTGLLYGITLPPNFDYPYLSTSIAVFWRRWHMSLSNWIRDYVYIPLGGSRVGIVRLYVNLVIVMLAVGIWHGATANFPVWGLYMGLGMVVQRVWSVTLGKRIPDTVWKKVIGIVLTFHFVTLGWAFFLTGSLQESLHIFGNLFAPLLRVL